MNTIITFITNIVLGFSFLFMFPLYIFCSPVRDQNAAAKKLVLQPAMSQSHKAYTRFRKPKEQVENCCFISYTIHTQLKKLFLLIQTTDKNTTMG